MIPNPLTDQSKPNFGWPCVEGRDAVSEIYQNWLRYHLPGSSSSRHSVVLLATDPSPTALVWCGCRSQGLLYTCAGTYRGSFNRPAYQYRYGPVDPDFPQACADADASVSGITFYTGTKKHCTTQSLDEQDGRPARQHSCQPGRV